MMITHYQNEIQSNGEERWNSNRNQSDKRFDSERTSSQAQMRSPLTLQNADNLGYQYQMVTPIMMIGIGTQGSTIVWKIIDLLKGEFGKIPDSTTWLTLDGAATRVGVDTTHHKDLPQLNGSGTDPNEGLVAFESVYSDIRSAVENLVLDLDPFNSLLPVHKTIQESVAFHIFAGNGGTSGGIQQAMIDLIHHVINRLKIRIPRIQLTFLGADMPHRDVERKCTPEQKLLIQRTAAYNMTRYLHDFHSQEMLKLTPPDDHPFFIPASQRLWSLELIDQSNGFSDFSTTEQLNEMISAKAFSTIFTHSGIFIEDRIADHEGCGITHRGYY